MSVIDTIDELLQNSLREHGHDRMPRILVCPPELAQALYMAVGLDYQRTGTIETDVGVITVQVDLRCPPDTGYLVHEYEPGAAAQADSDEQPKAKAKK